MSDFKKRQSFTSEDDGDDYRWGARYLMLGQVPPWVKDSDETDEADVTQHPRYLKHLRWATGGVFLGLGLRLAFIERR